MPVTIGGFLTCLLKPCRKSNGHALRLIHVKVACIENARAWKEGLTLLPSAPGRSHTEQALNRGLGNLSVNRTSEVIWPKLSLRAGVSLIAALSMNPGLCLNTSSDGKLTTQGSKSPASSFFYGEVCLSSGM